MSDPVSGDSFVEPGMVAVSSQAECPGAEVWMAQIDGGLVLSFTAMHGAARRDVNRPTVFFGAFDRHNFGDILLGHVAAAERGAGVGVFAGLAARDLTGWGGQRVAALDALTAP
ncbi:MAG TPA: hypothetical protein VJ572_10975, partial [Azonexus sp.]|nr:hypothetical protein [Azonexus sp.]